MLRLHLLTRDQLYILQYFTPDILTAFVGLHSVYYLDFHKLFVEYAQNQLRSTEIHTSTDVKCVDRSGENPVLTYSQPCKDGTAVEEVKLECSSVIFAFPPNLDNLEKVGVELTEIERDTFTNVTTHQYYSAAVDFAMPFGVSYIANSTSPRVPPPNDGEPVAVLHLNQQSNVSVTWAWGPYEFQSEEDARNILIESLGRINKDPRNINETVQPFTSDDVKAFRKWDYFPHFEGGALLAGAYDKLNKLQGQKKTFYASGLSGMEIVEWAIRGGRAVVDEYLYPNGTVPNPPTSSTPTQPSPTPVQPSSTPTQSSSTTPVPPVSTGAAGKTTVGLFAVAGAAAAFFL